MKTKLLVKALGINAIFGSVVFSMDGAKDGTKKDLLKEMREMGPLFKAQIAEMQLSFLLTDLKKEKFARDLIDQERIARELIVSKQQVKRDCIMENRLRDLVDKAKKSKTGSLVSINMSGATAVAPATYNTLILTDRQVEILAGNLQGQVPGRRALGSSSNVLSIEDAQS